MIGNDIVDLAQAKQDSNWRRARFLDKVFTDHEQHLILTANEPDCMVWLLWSLKESVYKLVSRQTGKRVFAPQKIACHITDSGPETVEGIVFYEGTYQTKSLITNKYVATLAYSASGSQPVSQTIIPFRNTTYQTQHTVIRNEIKHYCATRFSIPESSVHIHKNELGAPTIRLNATSGIPVNLPLSMSHHGHYGAYVIGIQATKETIE